MLLPTTQRALLHRTAVAQAENRLPSLVCAVIRDGDTWKHAIEGSTDTQYRIGSLTKAFIAVLVMRLRDEGQLGPVRLDHLNGAPMVAYPPTCDQPRLERELAQQGVHPVIVFRAAGNEALLSMVRAGLGWAILPRLAVHAAGIRGDDTLRVHALRPAPHPREIHLLWQADRTHSPLATHAIAAAAEVAHEVAGELRQPEPARR